MLVFHTSSTSYHMIINTHFAYISNYLSQQSFLTILLNRSPFLTCPFLSILLNITYNPHLLLKMLILISSYICSSIISTSSYTISNNTYFLLPSAETSFTNMFIYYRSWFLLQFISKKMQTLLSFTVIANAVHIG